MEYWPKVQRKNHFSSQRTKLVCKACRAQGFHPADLETYTCQTCACEFGGHNFDQDLLGDYKNRSRKRPRRLMCLQCAAAEKRMLRCARCTTAYEWEYWPKWARTNHSSSQQTKLVCQACRAQGFHPGDLKTYTCQTCAREFGAKKINQNQLHHFKYHQRKKLRCMQCVDATVDRVRQLREQLRKSKRKCTQYCRERQGGNCGMHHRKCPLTPQIFGERRWPGSDGAISADDRKFLDEQNPPPAWWSRAWGR